MIRRLVKSMAACPPVFDALRWLLEAGFEGHHQIVRKEILPGGGFTLDCGCGTGIYASFFDNTQYRGIDINEGYITTARQKFPTHSFRRMDGAGLDFDDNIFDKCFVSGVFHHMDDGLSDKVLIEIRRVLKQGGLLVVWEDVPARSRLNFIGEFVHKLDEGPYIRKPHEYRALLERHFRLKKEYGMRSGFMDYQVFCLTKEQPEALA